jgi:Flp pilus assembly pilin Flp
MEISVLLQLALPRIGIAGYWTVGYYGGHVTLTGGLVHMRNLMLKLWNEDRGALLATEWVFVSTIMVIGVVAGLKSVQQAVVTELADLANAVGSLSQTYTFSGTSGCAASTTGSRFNDVVHSVNFTSNAQDYNNSAAGSVCPD